MHRALHRLHLRDMHRHLDGVLHRHVHDLRHGNLPNLLHGLDFHARHVDVLDDGDVLHFDAGNVANDFLRLHHFHGHVHNLVLRDLNFLVDSLNLDAYHFPNVLLHLHTRHVADDLLNLGDLHHDVLDLYLGHLNHTLHGLDLHTSNLAGDLLHFHARHVARHHLRHRHINEALARHDLRSHRRKSVQTAHHRSPVRRADRRSTIS